MEITGKTFGHWTVIGRGDVLHYRGVTVHRWLCRCACGKETLVRGGDLRYGKSTNCGCKRQPYVTHKLSRTPEYNVWCYMHTRCYNPNTKRWDRYGGRGIEVCPRWSGPDGFTNFLYDMGPRPSARHSIDRYPNNDGNYEPGNCRWATPKEQAGNKQLVNRKYIGPLKSDGRFFSSLARQLRARHSQQ